MINLLVSEQEDIDQEGFKLSFKSNQKKLDRLSIKLLLNGPYDNNNCYIEIHAGAGGTEACDWALMLYRMYLRYCEKNGFKVEIVDYQNADEAGIKSASIKVIGSNAYGYLKSEKGVHRLVRISPFDANKKRHTSFASIDIIPEIETSDIKLYEEKDLKIDVYRASGAGGQHVNTTDSAVRITHIPTKTVVTCQQERSQIKNKERALKMLNNKLNIIAEEKKEAELNQVKGIQKNIEFGSQIRSYVMQPYTMVKDHRTNYYESDVTKVLDGYLDNFIEEYLKKGN